MKRVNQAEVARVSGVSISTVSRVLSQAPGISDPVRNKVLSAARDLGYVFRRGTDPLEAKIDRAVLFVGQAQAVTDVSAVYSQVIDGIRFAAEASGLSVQFALLEGGGRLPKTALRERTGLLFLGIDPPHEILSDLRQREIPVVLVNGLDADLIADSVSPANYFGGRLAAKHLLEMGHTDLTILQNTGRWTLRRRIEGFLSGIKEFAGEKDVTLREFHIDSLSGQAVFEAEEMWLPKGRCPSTAVFCGNDLVAVAAIQALTSHGIRVPEDVSVLGYDDLPVAQMSEPGLTTIRVDWTAIGKEAIRLVLARSSANDAPVAQVQIGGHLVRRQSVAMPSR
ncbi:LacI family DNA-binding transcriptional regulator [Cognatishimia maritima]|uniref:Transcriptional regulator, LacI family n=1 Tax=Cognatishimia maritima TaxID=870908 RepID=A0A1M5QM07_9RHOB|nr:LacI family DNA-binding transcriptional regulator [Cognatishimia maritima]SHH15167.1 transcriptional regulator, LacI family [Cognatishimia maritima]